MKSSLLAFVLLTVAAHAQAPAAKPTLQDLAWIEGPGRDGKPRRVEYRFKRVTS